MAIFLTIGGMITPRSERTGKRAVTAKGKPVDPFSSLGTLGNYIAGRAATDRSDPLNSGMAYTHPVAGDPAMDPRENTKGQGQFLHARTLGFTHLAQERLLNLQQKCHDL